MAFRNSAENTMDEKQEPRDVLWKMEQNALILKIRKQRRIFLVRIARKGGLENLTLIRKICQNEMVNNLLNVPL